MDLPLWTKPSEPIPLSIPHMPSLEPTPELEPKPIPVNLRSSFLRTNDTPPIIISNGLLRSQESSLLGVLEEYKEITKVENYLSIPIHDSFLDEKLFRNTQSRLP
jgi:hypothetical protein